MDDRALERVTNAVATFVKAREELRREAEDENGVVQSVIVFDPSEVETDADESDEEW